MASVEGTARERSEAEAARESVESLTRQYRKTLREIEILQEYARSAGKPIPEAAQRGIGVLAEAAPSAAQRPSKEQVTLALAVHGSLSTAVAPATVRTLQATDPDQPWTRWMVRFWVVPLIFALTVLALIALILLSPASADATGSTPSESPAPASTVRPGWTPPGKTLAAVLRGDYVQYLVAATLGAGFYSLFTAYGYISARTFDPTYNIVYLVRFLLGIVSGTILATFGPSMGLQGFTATLLGLIGGYSAEAVNQILLRVGETMVAAVKGSGKEQVKEREAAVRSEAREQQAQQRQLAGKELTDILAVAVGGGAPNPALAPVIDRVKAAMKILSP